MIKVLEPGLHTTVQDLGRQGNYYLGVPPSGAADKSSFLLGNLLVGNPADYASLEFTLLGPNIEFQKKTVIAITGAPAMPRLNNNPIPMWEAVAVREGDVVSFEFIKKGVKAYLCISGGIQVDDFLGSKSTYIAGGFSGFLSRKVVKGDQIPIGEPLPGVFKQTGKRIPDEFIPKFKKDHDVRVVLGFSSYRISDEGIKAFLNSPWMVSAESDRVGYRYCGGAISFTEIEQPFGAGSGPTNVVDTAYPVGGILVPNREEIIILLNDATLGGGFMTIGTVISTDLELISQSRPGSSTRFIAVTVEQAIKARLEKKKKLAQLIDLIS